MSYFEAVFVFCFTFLSAACFDLTIAANSNKWLKSCEGSKEVVCFFFVHVELFFVVVNRLVFALVTFASLIVLGTVLLNFLPCGIVASQTMGNFNTKPEPDGTIQPW